MDNYNCPNCEEQDTTRVTCPVCNTHFCEECEGHNFKRCHICDKYVCSDCYTDHSVNGFRTCDVCFDNLIVIKSNYDVLTLEINKLIKNYLNQTVTSPHYHIGMIKGQLQGLKNRFGF